MKATTHSRFRTLLKLGGAYLASPYFSPKVQGLGVLLATLGAVLSEKTHRPPKPSKPQ